MSQAASRALRGLRAPSADSGHVYLMCTAGLLPDDGVVLRPETRSTVTVRSSLAV